MIRAEVALSPEQYERLRQLAEAEQVSVSEEIERLLAECLLKDSQPRQKTIGEMAGAFSPLPSNAEGGDDQGLADAILESKRRV